ncbi:hypothetical protein NUK55_21555 [Aeromonas veronii]|uniref:hypothetical protein n=1 Tax=Aeromonas veronii TaxID=654 RepID=UPI00214D6FDE|nr:hypothetical protein [Aeromonas veronii]MCR3973656.1 hypothetical protein [Aeromonas veronii]MCR3977865.1 hypothetical protein [Aeromonas veronii]
MNTIKVVGIDIAKSVFQVCLWMADGSVAWNGVNGMVAPPQNGIRVPKWRM